MYIPLKIKQQLKYIYTYNYMYIKIIFDSGTKLNSRYFTRNTLIINDFEVSFYSMYIRGNYNFKKFINYTQYMDNNHFNM